MFYLTKEKQSKVDVAHLLYYPDESPDMELLHAHIKQLKVPDHLIGGPVHRVDAAGAGVDSDIPVIQMKTMNHADTPVCIIKAAFRRQE